MESKDHRIKRKVLHYLSFSAKNKDGLWQLLKGYSNLSLYTGMGKARMHTIHGPKMS